MSDAFVGEIRPFPYPYAPEDWLECNGQIVNVNQYQLLYAVLGNIYGGSAPVTFGVPNLAQSVPIGAGQGTGLSTYALGKTYGIASVPLTQDNLQAHSHAISVKRSSNQSVDTTQNVSGSELTSLFATPPGQTITSAPSFQTTTNATMDAHALTSTGGSSPHENRQPFLALRFCIAYEGQYPVPA